jgi:uncharacterized protein YqhQ
MNTFLDPTGVSNFLPAHNLEGAIGNVPVLTCLVVNGINPSYSLVPSTASASRPKSFSMENRDSDVENLSTEKLQVQEVWTPTKKEWLIMLSLAFISLMVALDATILVTVLPVSMLETLKNHNTDRILAGHS